MHLARFPRRYSMLHFELESANVEFLQIQNCWLSKLRNSLCLPNFHAIYADLLAMHSECGSPGRCARIAGNGMKMGEYPQKTAHLSQKMDKPAGKLHEHPIVIAGKNKIALVGV